MFVFCYGPNYFNFLSPHAEQPHHFDMGYKAFMYYLYGDNIMFDDTAEAARLHRIILSLFGNGGLPDVDRVLDRLIERHLSDLDSK